MSLLHLRLPALATGVALVVSLAGCGGGTQDTPAPATVTVTAEPTTSATSAVADRTSEPAPAARKRLPNVVGKNLQAAQDLMQSHGFYVLNDKDATGQNRFQVYDRNWVVTRQQPAAGRRVSLDTPITLWAKKYGE